jgi:hypothetical protein
VVLIAAPEVADDLADPVDALNRRDQLPGSSTMSLRSTSNTASTPALSITSRTPMSSTFSMGSSMVRSVACTLRVMYSFGSPLIVRVLTAVMVAAPWWG